MTCPGKLHPDDFTVLLRVVGSRKGADLDAVLAFERAHQRKEPRREEALESLNRLVAAELIVQQGNQYFGTPEVQSAFLDECRNCRDTMEEFNVLNRIIARFGRFETPSDSSAPQPPGQTSRWRED